jgi:prepilin-type processing-associated H-X9-DG protein
VHDGGCNFGFCDGAVRFISQTIDGTVYAKLITPAGESLPEGLRQTPMGSDEVQEAWGP